MCSMRYSPKPAHRVDDFCAFAISGVDIWSDERYRYIGNYVVVVEYTPARGCKTSSRSDKLRIALVSDDGVKDAYEWGITS